MRSHTFTWKWKQLGAKNSFSKLIYFNEIFTKSFNHGQNVPPSNAASVRLPCPKFTSALYKILL